MPSRRFRTGTPKDDGIAARLGTFLGLVAPQVPVGGSALGAASRILLDDPKDDARGFMGLGVSASAGASAASLSGGIYQGMPAEDCGNAGKPDCPDEVGGFKLDLGATASAGGTIEVGLTNDSVDVKLGLSASMSLPIATSELFKVEGMSSGTIDLAKTSIALKVTYAKNPIRLDKISISIKVPDGDDTLTWAVSGDSARTLVGGALPGVAELAAIFALGGANPAAATALSIARS